MAAPAPTFSLPASYINTRMVFLPPTAVPSGTLSHPSMLPPPASATLPPRIRFAAVTTTTTTATSTTSTRRRIANWSDESAPVSEYFTGHTDEHGHPLGRTLTPYPARKVCGVDWTSMSELSDDFEHEYDQGYHLEQMQECKREENASTTRHVSFAAGLRGSDSDSDREFGSKLVRTPTPYPRTGTGTDTTTMATADNTVSASNVGAKKKRFWREYLTKLKSKLGALERKTSWSRSSSRSREAKGEERRTPSPNSLRHERSMRAVFGEEATVYDGGCRLVRCEARGQ